MWLEELPVLKEKPIEWCLEMKSGAESELHCFSDASMMRTAVVAYLRQKQAEGRWMLRFLMAKTKMSPGRALAMIPRLEFAAAVTSARLAPCVRRELRIDGKVFFHTDSQAVLRFILTEQNRLPVFVANRVREIRNLTSPKSWCYVITKDNPADEGSRGLKAKCSSREASG